MKGKGKWLILFCAVMTLGTGLTASALGSVKIRLDQGSKSSWTEEIRIPAVTVNYSEESPKWSKPIEEWEPGKKVTGTLRLPGAYSETDCTVYGGRLVSVKTEEGETVIKVSYTPGAKLGQTEEAGWGDAARTKAVWKKVPFASRYQVMLYKQDGTWVKSLTTSSVSIDLLPYMEGKERHYYTVKAILMDSSEEDYLAEGDPVTSGNSILQDQDDRFGTWEEYNNRKKYRMSDGSWVTGKWQMIRGEWYCFNEEGYASVGWQYSDGKWYYLGEDGHMLTGWQQINGKWYYLKADGSMAIGWLQMQPGEWYYFYGDGSMASDTKVDGIYRINSSGLWLQ